MRFDIPKIIKAVSLGGYAPELEAVVVSVWVNPPRNLLDGYIQLTERTRQIQTALDGVAADTEQTKTLIDELNKIALGFSEFYSALWSQGGDPASHWTVDDVKQLATLDTDPALYQYLTERTWAAIHEHRSAHRKN